MHEGVHVRFRLFALKQDACLLARTFPLVLSRMTQLTVCRNSYLLVLANDPNATQPISCFLSRLTLARHLSGKQEHCF